MPYLRRYSPTKLCDGAQMANFGDFLHPARNHDENIMSASAIRRAAIIITLHLILTVCVIDVI